MVLIKETVTPYPRIDADPHFSRVVRYMRPSDYAVWGATTAAVPGGLYAWG
jgi:NADH-ubiquinone oxidoreductase complex I, 21 kDa subunit